MTLWLGLKVADSECRKKSKWNHRIAPEDVHRSFVTEQILLQALSLAQHAIILKNQVAETRRFPENMCVEGFPLDLTNQTKDAQFLPWKSTERLSECVALEKSLASSPSAPALDARLYTGQR